jgi:hypothetical protein
MASNTQLIPIYTTRGDVGAFLLYPFLYNRQGEWIGWVASNRNVYSVMGNFVGTLEAGPRILRRRSYDYALPRQTPPAPPRPIRPLANVPLPPLMSELSFSVIDVLEEEPELLPTVDHDELRQDMD